MSAQELTNWDDIIAEIEIELGWGCSADHVGQVLFLLEDVPKTDLNIRRAVWSVKKQYRASLEPVQGL